MNMSAATVYPHTSSEGRIAMAEVYGKNHQSIGAVIVLSKHNWIASYTNPACRFGCTAKGACGSVGGCKKQSVSTLPTAVEAALWVWDMEYHDYPDEVVIPDWFANMIGVIPGKSTPRSTAQYRVEHIEPITPLPVRPVKVKASVPRTRKEEVQVAQDTVDSALTKALSEVFIGGAP